MSGALSLSEEQREIARSVARFCAARCPPERTQPLPEESSGRFPRGLWRELGELGLFALATEDGVGGARELVAAMEELGRANVPGPLVGTAIAAQLLPAAERERVTSGEAVIAVGESGWFPWGPAADLLVDIAGDPSVDIAGDPANRSGAGARAWLVRVQGELHAVDTLGGEGWGRAVAVEPVLDLGDATAALSLGDVARAAYLAGLGQALIDAAAEHARTRTQFGRPIGEFQAVAHPLAQCAVHLSAARGLARLAAAEFDRRAAGTPASAAAARLSAARAALTTASVSAQVFGGMGAMDEGPVYPRARRIRQLVSAPPGPARAESLVLGPTDPVEEAP